MGGLSNFFHEKKQPNPGKLALWVQVCCIRAKFCKLKLLSHNASRAPTIRTTRCVGILGVELYAVRATDRVPAGSGHFPCSTDPSQSVVSFPCVRKWERIKTKYATNASALAHWLWPRCSRPANRRLQWSTLNVSCRALNFWCMPIVPFVFSGLPLGLRASMEL